MLRSLKESLEGGFQGYETLYELEQAIEAHGNQVPENGLIEGEDYEEM